jgi:Glu-tRNA(Gln) amidotransferase subunit E-like FAD-binding protein
VLEERFASWGIDRAIARAVAGSERGCLLDRAVQDLGANAKDAARLLHQNWKELARKGVPVERIPAAELEGLLAEIASRRLRREGFRQALTWLAITGGTNRARPRGNIQTPAHRLQSLLVPWVEDTYRKIGPWRCPASLVRAAMGVAMTRLAGLVEGRLVRELIEEIVARRIGSAARLTDDSDETLRS